MLKNKRGFVKFAAVMILIVVLAIVALQYINRKPQIIVAITFDTEYPNGIPENISISETQWKKAVNDLLGISIMQDVSFQFNVVGKTAEKYPELIKELASKNSISCHSYSHLRQTSINYSQKQEEISKCKDAVTRATGKRIYGNRFPYTDYDNDSMKILSEQGYLWDSSVWAPSKNELNPYLIGNLTEFPILLPTDDWGYFFEENKSGSNEFYGIFEKEILSLKHEKIVYIVILHPWILSIDEKRIEGLDIFIENLKKERIEIKSLGNIYKT